ncbi:MAG: type transport system permease protein [Chloroflexota bacterium]|jgi:ABC-2 type transport system permease protein|nr:type transport system permease protein [Chloroflexota bacterium]
MTDMLSGPFKSLSRILAQVRKELIQVRRRPGAFISLVLGPFLIMAIFGLGYTGVRRPLETVVVVPPDVALSRDPNFYQALAGPALHVVSVDETPDAAHAQLAAQQLDLVVVAPADAAAQFRSGRQAQIEVLYNSVDPIEAGYADFLAGVLDQQINREIIRQAVAEGESYLIENATPPIRVPPEVIAAPTTVHVTNLAPTKPNVVGFAAPAALALMLQHMAVTLTALSFVRERMSGALELLRVSPVNSLELVLGKYIGLGIVSALIATITVVLLVAGLGVPMLGSWVTVGLVITLLIIASLGVGLIISVVSDSERQAVQLCLLLLLASVFFSGFVLPVHEFREGVQYGAYILPVTHGIKLLQDLMLRGDTTAWWQLSALGALAGGFLILTVVLLRRTLRSA